MVCPVTDINIVQHNQKEEEKCKKIESDGYDIKFDVLKLFNLGLQREEKTALDMPGSNIKFLMKKVKKRRSHFLEIFKNQFSFPCS